MKLAKVLVSDVGKNKMKPNKQYKAIMVELEVAEKVKLRKNNFTVTSYLEYLMDLEDKLKSKINAKNK